ncbi:hypothetical protein VE03_07186 [Pseudogymnoascus sp. 23342-1-I1]|nr:hypothetical protein VE03_07186 [Pseudogymnoascus sp. 23342-1-I1]
MSDSPLSITASVTGILTFVVAIGATIWLRVSAIRSADEEFSRVQMALSWYKTESEWIDDLIATQREAQNRTRESFEMRSRDSDAAWREKARQREMEMYVFVLDQLGMLEKRLVEVVTGVELKVGVPRLRLRERAWGRWIRAWRRKMRIGVHWLPVRTMALELVRQRDALGNRILFTQLAMVSSRLADGEERAYRQDERISELLRTVKSFDDRLPQIGLEIEKLTGGEERAYRQDERIREILETVKSFDQRLPRI